MERTWRIHAGYCGDNASVEESCEWASRPGTPARSQSQNLSDIVNRQASYWIRKLGLTPHPEGGHYLETYRAAGSIPASGLPRSFGGTRSFSTAICFLLQGKQRSKLHRIKSDEIWHFYCGTTVVLHILGGKGRCLQVRLGRSPRKGEVFQAVVPAGCWFGAKLVNGHSYALVGCTVAPGFDFRDFELGDRELLFRRYPQHRRAIEDLT